MKNLVSFVTGVALTAVGLGLFVLHVPLALVGTVAAGLACLVWLVVIVVLPWNLYFQARHLSAELGRSKARGVVVTAAQEQGAKDVAQRMLRISIGLHVGSAALLALGAAVSGEALGGVFSGLFLISTWFRPAVEYYRYVRRQLSDVLEETKYPREDVVKLIRDVEAHQAQLETQRVAQQAMAAELAEVRATATARVAEAHRRLDGVTRKFEESLDRLTDNREVIAGLKAFLRLVRE